MDEHYYLSPQKFFEAESKYDKYNRKGPKVYIGEYAAGGGRGNWIAALSEAAFMTGMERNSDVVEMGSYAPLFSNPAWEAWNPNAIVFDSSRAYGTPSYYVQALFGKNKPDVMLPVDLTVSAAPQEPISGTFGLGSFNTQVEYKDILVVGANGEELFKGGDSLNGWKKGAGKWAAQDGVIKQTGNESPSQLLIEGKNWSDCTLTLKARKTGGAEGFVIPFGVKNLDDSCRWNIGGWGNKQSALEWDEESKKQNVTIETNRWYDIKVELKGQNVKCSLDGKIIHDVTRTKMPKSFFAVAGRMNETNEIIVKVVNGSQQAQEMSMEVTGAKALASTGKAIIMASDDPKGENTFTEPTKIAPKEEKLEGVSDKMKRTFPPYSITVLRLQEKK
ncbi:TPA: hypothetical protein DDW35_11610 [Candidatus Sumerlaeota bacterium]|nr:hypothetical protein [Candidatus Sumerlaeota bacterium]